MLNPTGTMRNSTGAVLSSAGSMHSTGAMRNSTGPMLESAGTMSRSTAAMVKPRVVMVNSAVTGNTRVCVTPPRVARSTGNLSAIGRAPSSSPGRGTASPRNHLLLCVPEYWHICAADERNVVPPEIPNACEAHAVTEDRHRNTNQAAGNNVVPIVRHIKTQLSDDNGGGDDRSDKDQEFPVRGVVVGEDLEVRVQVESAVKETCPSSNGMST